MVYTNPPPHMPHHSNKGTTEKLHTEKRGSSELASFKLSQLCESIKNSMEMHGFCMVNNEHSELCQQIEKHCP